MIKPALSGFQTPVKVILSLPHQGQLCHPTFSAFQPQDLSRSAGKEIRGLIELSSETSISDISVAAPEFNIEQKQPAPTTCRHTPAFFLNLFMSIPRILVYAQDCCSQVITPRPLFFCYYDIYRKLCYIKIKTVDNAIII